MHDVYRHLPVQDRERMERIEFFDELELLVQLLQHYSLSWGVNDSQNIGFSRLGLSQRE
jgi:[phosphatase 2A protein]-leucine-carboxy methyltransferase